jgi:hypothetical protein
MNLVNFLFPTLATALSMLLAATAGHAENRIESPTIEIYPTCHCVGLDVSYQGDDNGNCAAEFQYKRKGDSDWTQGVEMTFDRNRKRIWASAFRFNPGEEVEVKVSITDPDISTPLTLEGQTRLRTLVAENSDGREIHVDIQASEGGDGSKTRPYRKVADAVGNLKPGDTVWIHPGIYHENIALNGVKGSPKKPIVIRGAVSNVTATKVKPLAPFTDGDSGVMPVLTSYKSLAPNVPWKEHGDDIYSTPVPDVGLEKLAVSRAQTGYVTIDGGRMYCYRTLQVLRENPLENALYKNSGVELHHYLRIKGSKHVALPGWTYDSQAGLLYVRMEKGKRPHAHRFAYATTPYGIRLDNCSDVVIRDLEVGYFGTACISLDGDSDRCVILNNILHHSLNQLLVVSEEIDELAIWNNRIYDRGFHLYPWQVWMSPPAIRNGYGGIILLSGRGQSIVGNTIHDVFNVMGCDSAKNPNLKVHRDMDILDNYCYNAGDDAYEPDGGGVNVRLLNNRSFNTLTSFSIAPVERGPLYVMHNVAVARNYPFKLNNLNCNSTGAAYIYHNTVLAIGKGTRAINMPPVKHMKLFGNKYFRNNLLMTGKNFVDTGRDGATLDYNCYWRTDGDPNGEARFKWHDKGEFTGIKAFFEGTGQEEHGFIENPQCANAPKYTTEDLFDAMAQAKELHFDLSIQPSSPCVDRGVKIRGINSDFKGEAPDVGAFEIR